MALESERIKRAVQEKRGIAQSWYKNKKIEREGKFKPVNSFGQRVLVIARIRTQSFELPSFFVAILK